MCDRNEKAIWVNKHILKPFKKFYSQITVNNEVFEVEIHRAQYWFDDKPVTDETTRQLKKTWHLSYWKKYENGGRIQLWTSNYPFFEMFYGDRKHALDFGRDSLSLIVESKKSIYGV